MSRNVKVYLYIYAFYTIRVTVLLEDPCCKRRAICILSFGQIQTTIVYFDFVSSSLGQGSIKHRAIRVLDLLGELGTRLFS